MTSTLTTLAFYKAKATKTLPLRPGPIQCIRNCANCVSRSDKISSDREEIISSISYDDLITRKSLKFQSYQTIQYHPGQIDILKASLSSSSATIYVVGLTNSHDINYLQMLLSHVGLPNLTKLDRYSHEVIKNSYITIRFKTCSDVIGESQPLLSPVELRDYLTPFFDQNFTAVPVIITKDHSKVTILGTGSLCIQVLEPYNTSVYKPNIEISNISTHFVQHLYYDMSINAGVLPTHLVAFILLYSDCDYPINKKRLIDYFDWFRTSAIDTSMKICCTGETEDIVSFGLSVLNDYIDCREHTYRVRNTSALLSYARLIIPFIAYQAIVSRAILEEHNCKEKGEIMTSFRPSIRIKVLKDKVVETSERLAEVLETRLPIRRPCMTITSCITATMEKMLSFGRYIKIEEPTMRPRYKCAWAGDSDDDDDYWLRNRSNPALMSWIILTQRDYRLDRLNLMMNSLDLFL